MSSLWRTSAALALFAAAGCASPHYPIREGQQAGPEPLSAPQPRYPITEAPAPAPAAEAPPAPPAAPPTAAPLAPVESQPLPPAGAPAGPPTSPSASAAPVATPASYVTTSDAPAPAAAPSNAPVPPPPAPVETPLAPRVVAHDTAGPPPAAPAPSPPPPARAFNEARMAPRRAVQHESITGDVVAASGIFETYEVRKGDHVDALARAFKTSRSVILDANDLRSPYRLRPGELLKVPVAEAYVAEHGDTLNGVARRFGVEAGELAEINHISTRAPLRSGQKIGLPSSMHDRGPLRSAGAGEEYAEAPRRRGPERTFAGPNADLETPLPASRGPFTPLAPSAAGPTPWRPTPPSVAYQAPPPARTTPQAAPALTDAQVSAATQGKFAWPVRGDVVGRFGPMAVGQRNDGIDIKAPQGTSVRASAAGEVVYAGDQVKGGFGKLVLVEHADGWFTAYAHLDSISVHMKDQVTQGEELGQVGMSGDATQPMLHFEMRYHPAPGAKTQPVDPALALPAS